jgi:hypothetical protein
MWWHSPGRQGARMTTAPVQPVAACRSEAQIAEQRLQATRLRLLNMSEDAH